MLCLCGYLKPTQARLHGAPRKGGPSSCAPDLQVWGAWMVQGMQVCSMPYVLLPTLSSMYGKGGGGG